MTFAGLDGIYTGFVNSNGLFIGFAKVDAAGESSGLRRIKAAQTLPSALSQPQRKFIPGDDTIYDQFIFGPNELPGGDLEVGATDLALDAAAQGSTVWTLGNWDMGIYGISLPTFGNLLILGHQQAHNKDAGGSGSGFKNMLYPTAQLLPLGGDNPAHQAEGKNRYTATFSPFTKFPMGQLLDSTNFTVVDGIRVEWYSTYRCWLFAKQFAGGDANIVLDKTPIDAASTKVGLTTSGGSFSLATISSVTPGTKTVVLSAAPAADTIGVVLYEGLTT